MMSELIQADSEEFQTMLRELNEIGGAVEQAAAKARLSLLGARLLTGEEVCRIFHLSKRTLQTYRDNRILPYTTIGGKILYPEKDLWRLVVDNYAAGVSLTPK